MVAPLRRFELAAAAPEPVAPFEGRRGGGAARACGRSPASSPPRDDQLRGGALPRRRLARRRGGRAQPARRPARDRPPRRARRLPRPPPRPQRQDAGAERPAPGPAARRAAAHRGPGVKRKVDPTGYVSFAGRGYFVTSRLRGEQVEVRLAGDTVQISQRGELLKTHAAQARPIKGTRRLLDAARTTTPQQRLPLLKGREWNRSTGAKVERGWWDLTCNRN